MERLNGFVETSNLLNDSQSGYRRGRCTATPILSTILEAMNNRHAVVGIILTHGEANKTEKIEQNNFH